ncbi:hypothetical protein [Nocardia sp. NPDC051463]
MFAAQICCHGTYAEIMKASESAQKQRAVGERGNTLLKAAFKVLS